MDALSLSQIAAFGAAGAIAFAVWVLGDILTPNLLRGRQTSRLSMFASKGGAAETKTAVPVGSFAHRVQVAFSGVRMDASGREESLLFLARIAAGGAFAVGLFIIGLPPLTCLAGLPAGWIFVDSWITRSWSKVKTDVEGELPSMLTRLASIVQTSPNVPSAMETVAMTLRADGPLRQWCLDTAARMHRDGFAAIETIRENAVGISPSLAIATELVGRMWRTGGEGYSDRFLVRSGQPRGCSGRSRSGKGKRNRGAGNGQHNDRYDLRHYWLYAAFGCNGRICEFAYCANHLCGNCPAHCVWLWAGKQFD